MNEELRNIPIDWEIYDFKGKTFSPGVVRILHDGTNRNGTYISKKVAEEIAISMRGVPVIGEYKRYKKDFGDHGGAYDENWDYYDTTTPFGFVPLDAQYRWEKIYDANGENKDYITIDVVMWTTKYPEIEKFKGQAKHQSMELVPETIYGSFVEIEGETYYNIEQASGLALTILGDDVEPCFESASLRMYSKQESYIEKYEEMISEYNNQKGEQDNINKGGKEMFKFNKEIEELLKNEHFSTEEEGTYTVKMIPLGKVEEILYGYSLEDGKIVSFDAENSVINSYELNSNSELTEKKEELAEAVENFKLSEVEYASKIEKLEEEISNFSNDGKIEQLQTELDEAKENYNKQVEKNEALNSELEKLEEYKLKEKMEVLEKYSKLFDEEGLAEMKEKLKDFTLKDLKYELGVKAFDSIDKEDEESHTYNLHGHQDGVKISSWEQKIKAKRQV